MEQLPTYLRVRALSTGVHAYRHEEYVCVPGQRLASCRLLIWLNRPAQLLRTFDPASPASAWPIVCHGDMDIGLAIAGDMAHIGQIKAR